MGWGPFRVRLITVNTGITECLSGYETAEAGNFTVVTDQYRRHSSGLVVRQEIPPTVNGDYTGGGTLIINTVLGDDTCH